MSDVGYIMSEARGQMSEACRSGAGRYERLSGNFFRGTHPGGRWMLLARKSPVFGDRAETTGLRHFFGPPLLQPQGGGDLLHGLEGDFDEFLQR